MSMRSHGVRHHGNGQEHLQTIQCNYPDVQIHYDEDYLHIVNAGTIYLLAKDKLKCKEIFYSSNNRVGSNPISVWDTVVEDGSFVIHFFYQWDRKGMQWSISMHNAVQIKK